MTWWLWVLFWIVFWAAAAAYLARRAWRVWPHARDFARTVTDAWARLDGARHPESSAPAASCRSSTGSPGTMGEPGGALERSSATGPGDLAWNEPASYWRARHRRAKARRRELSLDEHATTWASWRRPLD